MGAGAGLCMYTVVIKKFTFAISSPDEFLVKLGAWDRQTDGQTYTRDGETDRRTSASLSVVSLCRYVHSVFLGRIAVLRT